MKPLAQHLLAQVPPDLQPVVTPLLADLVQGTDAATTRAHLSVLASLPGITVEGWPDEPDGVPLRFVYRLRIGEATACIRLFKEYRTKAGPWQLSAHNYP